MSPNRRLSLKFWTGTGAQTHRAWSPGQITSLVQMWWLVHSILTLLLTRSHSFLLILWNGCLVPKSCPTLATPWTIAHQYSLCPWDFPGKNTGVGCHFLLQIFLTQGLKPHLLHWQADFFFFFFNHWATWETQRTSYCLTESVKVHVNIVYWENALDPSSVFIVISTTFSIVKNNLSCSFPEISRLSILAF